MFRVKKLFLILIAMDLSLVLATDDDTSVNTDFKGKTLNADFSGKSLIAMGAAINSPLLRLLGKTFIKLEREVSNGVSKLEGVTKDVDNKTKFVLNELEKEKDNSSLEQRLVTERNELIDIICQLHVCTDWTQWTDCTAETKGIYGAQNRSRTCGNRDIKLCKTKGQRKTEVDYRVCEGQWCPKNYTLTGNGFCIGLHLDVKYNRSAAASACKQEGGYLVNIDSELKADDVNGMLEEMSWRNRVWIDGIRTQPSGPWRHEYGPNDPTYSNWLFGKPDNIFDCRVYMNNMNQWYWLVQTCWSEYSFICEIIYNMFE